MEKWGFSVVFILCRVVMMLLLPQATLGKPRAQVIQWTCTSQRVINMTVFAKNLVATMETIRTQLEIQGYGVAATGKGPDAYYNLAQCYGDLSSVDCMLCYSVLRTFTSQCYPFNGATRFLDGCFMRSANYNFFQEYTGPEDKAVCGNRTRKNLAFQETARQAVLQAASNAPTINGYARVEMLVFGTRNESAYVLAQCWRILNANSCRACLENASTSIQGCLPSSEGRALNTGCFMRYSDTNFLNPIQSNGSSSGTRTLVIAVVVSSIIFVAGVTVSGVYIWKHRRIEKKRRGFYDAKKLARALRDSSLNFKYSVLEKATGGFEEANKLGQGGFGTVYKAWKHFQRGTAEELIDPNLVLQNEGHTISIKSEAQRVVHIGLLCTQEIAALRPSMSKALQMLAKRDEHLPPPTNAPFIDEETIELDCTSENASYYPLIPGNFDSVISDDADANGR